MITPEYQVRTNCIRTNKKKCNLEFIFPKVYRIDCENDDGDLKGVAFRFRLLGAVGRPSHPLFLRRPAAFSFFFSTQPRLSHSIRPSRSVVTALRLYKFYIIFMRHKVVEKATAERRKRIGVRARRCAKGKFLRVQTIPLGPVSPPPVGV